MHYVVQLNIKIPLTQPPFCIISCVSMFGLVNVLVRPTHRPSISRLTKESKRAGLPGYIRYNSSIPRPYSFYIGASWAGKPVEPGLKKRHVSFAPDSLVGAWRDKTLSRPKSVVSKDAGEDFFYVQEVSLQTTGMKWPQYLYLYGILSDAQWVGGYNMNQK